MANENEKLLPSIPVLNEYMIIKQELTAKIEKLNLITVLTEDNKKEVKNGIAEINKVKERISRYRIDETNRFLAYIQPYVDKCKELEKLCDTGLSSIKAKVKELETQEKENKTKDIQKMFEFVVEQDHPELKSLLKFEMFFIDKYANKTSSMTMIEKELKEWLAQRASDIKFIKNNIDEPEVILNIYLSNGLKLTSAIEEHQKRYASEAEIKAAIAKEEAKPATNTFEKKIDIQITIKQLPKSKVAALQSFLDGLGVEFEFNKL